MRLQLCGDVVSNDTAEIYRYFGYTVCCPGDVRTALTQCPEEEDLIFEINSGGGSVYAGFEMYSLLRTRKGRTVAEVQSLAASAMSVIIAACDTVLMSPVAEIMVHKAAVPAQGNSRIMRQTAQWLDTIDASILNAYIEKSGGKTDREQFARMMRNETFLTAQEAIECGLADGILDSPDDKISPGLVVASAFQILAENRLPPVTDLLRRKREIENNLSDKIPDTPGERMEKIMDENSVKNEINTEKIPDEPIETPEQLMKKYPALTQQIISNAAKNERERIAAIDAAALPGFEDLITRAKANPDATAGSVALEMIAAQKKSGAIYLANRDADINTGNANSVPAAPAPDDNPADDAALAADTAALWKNKKEGDLK